MKSTIIKQTITGTTGTGRRPDRTAAALRFFLLTVCSILFSALFFNAAAAGGSFLDIVQGEYSESEGLKLLESVPRGTDENLYRGIIYHNIASPSNPDYEKKAESELAKIKDTNPVARVYYGSVLTIQAGTASKKRKLIKALALLNSGFSEMDKAVKQAPDDINIRFTRMINSIEVSEGSPMKRYDVAKQDIEYLKTKSDSLSAAAQAQLYYWEGEYYLSQREATKAIECYSNSIKTAPQSVYAKNSQSRIDAIND